MTETATASVVETAPLDQNNPFSELAERVEKIAVAAEIEDTPAGPNMPQEQQRPRIIYTRKQLVHLSQSPLIKQPDGMPSFKAWFGEWNEPTGSSSKKDGESANVNGALRDRRFRRDAEDGDGPTRPSFRSALSSQPSQMGNFKHQPLRTNNDRDRDTGDLRSLSDKFDREKRNVALPANSTLLRNRERDSAPHLASEREGPQRNGLKKRNGESSDDWRRGADSGRNGRDEPHGKREKDERSRQESPPLNRRDRDRERFNDADDENRRWRDDGRRRDRGRDRSRDLRDEDGWTLSEDRRRGGRERKIEEAREREERRNREKEQEPAWMETYVPPSASAGILGGKGTEGEVDDIQAWKKDMKEREQKAKGVSGEPSIALEPLEPLEPSNEVDVPKSVPAEGQLDEIQLFKLMMKKEEQKRGGNQAENPADDALDGSAPDSLHEPINGTRSIVNGSTTSTNDPTDAITSLPRSLSNLTLVGASTGTSTSPSVHPTSSPTMNLESSIPRAESGGSRFLSLGATADQAAAKDAPLSASFDPPRQSRLLAFGTHGPKVSAQPNPQNAAAAAQLGRLQSESFPSSLRGPSASPTIPVSVSQQTIFNKANAQQVPFNGMGDLTGGEDMRRRLALESGAYNPLGFESGRLSNPNLSTLNEFKGSEPLRSAPIGGLNDRIPQAELFQGSDIRRNATPPNGNFNLTSPVSPYESQGLNNHTVFAAGRGSRMQKFFEKPREQPPPANRNIHGQPMGLNALPNRAEQPSHNSNMQGGTRNIQDLLTMLNNSAQRGNQGFDQVHLHQGPPAGHLGPSGALNRHDSLSDPEEGRFAPDGLVPGLRPAPPPRSRDVSGGSLYNNPLDDLNVNARMNLQRGGLDQMYHGQMQAQFNGQNISMGRSGGVPQQVLRNNPSLMNNLNFNSGQGIPQQRLPPGLANLGGRPPHEPSQFIGGGGFNNLPPQFQGGMPQQLAGGGLSGLQNPNLALLSNQSLLRGQPSLGQLGNGLGDGPNLRNGPGGPLQNQMLGLGGQNIGQGMRGGVPPFNGQQLHNANMPGGNLRQHQLQPQLMQQQLLSQQMQGIAGGQPNPNDLIALLMGENRRD